VTVPRVKLGLEYLQNIVQRIKSGYAVKMEGGIEVVGVKVDGHGLPSQSARTCFSGACGTVHTRLCITITPVL
jgi:hypothetical protein